MSKKEKIPTLLNKKETEEKYLVDKESFLKEPEQEKIPTPKTFDKEDEIYEDVEAEKAGSQARYVAGQIEGMGEPKASEALRIAADTTREMIRQNIGEKQREAWLSAFCEALSNKTLPEQAKEIADQIRRREKNY